MNAKFSEHDQVKTPVAAGTVKQVAPFPDHFEYLVEFPDKTASWIDESILKPTSKKPSTSK
jgi:hypothetical protein